MNRLLKLVVGLVVAWVIIRLLSVFFRPVRVGLEKQLSSMPPYHQPPSPWPADSDESSPIPTNVDRTNLNMATAETLAALPRIGPKLAARIINQREQSGAFASVDDLIQVQGVGQALMERLRPLVTV